MTSEEAAAAAVAPVLLEKWTKITLDVPLLVDVITDRQTYQELLSSIAGASMLCSIIQFLFFIITILSAESHYYDCSRSCVI